MELTKITSLFNFAGNITETKSWGSGHINETYLITTDEKRYILQKINTNVFPQAALMMDNIEAVTNYISAQLKEEGTFSERTALYLIKTIDNSYYINNELGFWRAYNYIEDSISLDKVENPEQFYKSGIGFGNFQYMLRDFPTSTLHETIKDFHNTPLRFDTFKKAVEEDNFGMAKQVQKEIEFFMENEDFYSILTDKLSRKELPLRVTHNDTKLNNVMLDKSTMEPLCVVDLDTVMPGLSAYDFGDSIRFGASTALEDEPDLSKVQLDLELYEAFTNGFLVGLKNSLTNAEIFALPIGAKIITIEQGLRFLTDYLLGDSYYKINREHQNLDRSRTQIKLFEEMVKYQDEIDSIIKKYM